MNNIPDRLLPLAKFYQATTLEELVEAQAKHIERLQEKLKPLPDQFPPTPRRG